MIRTTKATVITYATVTVKDDGTLETTTATATVPESDAKRAEKQFKKDNPRVAVLSAVSKPKVFKMSDEFFFANAEELSDEEAEKYLATHTKNKEVDEG